MVLMTNQKLTKEIALTKNFIPDVKSKDITRERTRETKSISTNFNFIASTKNFEFIKLKLQRKFMNDYYHWGAMKKIIDVVNTRDKNTETRLLVAKRQDITKPRNLRFKFDNNLNRNLWVPRRLDKRGRDEAASTALELLFGSNEKKPWGWRKF